jgi:MFS family permease
LIATGLCLLNLLFVKRWLPESSSAEARAEAKQEQRESLGRRMLAVFQHPQLPVARLIWIYAVGMMAFMGMNAVLALFLQQRFGITEKSFGLFYVFVGAISLVMRSVLLGPAVRRFGEKGVMRIGLLSLAGGYALQALAPTVLTFGAAIMLIPVGTALLFPAASSLVSRFAMRHELGATMGVQQAYGGVARLVGPIWAGYAFQRFGSGAPFWISSGLALATLVFASGLSSESPERAEAAKPPAGDAAKPEAPADGGA